MGAMWAPLAGSLRCTASLVRISAPSGSAWPGSSPAVGATTRDPADDGEMEIRFIAEDGG